jgi:hypothetical protein
MAWLFEGAYKSCRIFAQFRLQTKINLGYLERDIGISAMSNDRLKYDRRWIERLQELPQYRLAVDKLLQGWSLDAVADWIMGQADRGPLSDLKRSTIRYYLNALNIRLKENARESSKNERILRAQRLARLVDEFTSGIVPTAGVVAQQAEPTEKKIKAMQTQHLSSMIDELTSDGVVRLMLKMYLPYIYRMAEWEKLSKKPVREWARNMNVLISAAAILQKNELARKLFESQMRVRNPVPELQQSEATLRTAKLTEVDRQLRRDAAEKFLIRVKRSRDEGA